MWTNRASHEGQPNTIERLTILFIGNVENQEIESDSLNWTVYCTVYQIQYYLYNTPGHFATGWCINEIQVEVDVSLFEDVNCGYELDVIILV